LLTGEVLDQGHANLRQSVDGAHLNGEIVEMISRSNIIQFVDFKHKVGSKEPKFAPEKDCAGHPTATGS
jgi:hypothetical protein